jgi:predicted amidohydrolase YtcJ
MRKAAILYIGLTLGAVQPVLAQSAETFDVVIIGGRVMDPETKRDEIANVAISGRQVVRIAREPMKGRRTIQAAGLVVSPGFVDLHAHGQHNVGQRFQVLDGVTTAIDAESGAMPVAPYFAAFAGKALINFWCHRIAPLCTHEGADRCFVQRAFRPER